MFIFKTAHTQNEYQQKNFLKTGISCENKQQNKESYISSSNLFILLKVKNSFITYTRK